jgi:hypothetical protein
MSKHIEGTWRAEYVEFDEFWEFDTGKETPSFGCFTGWQEEHADNQAVVDRIIHAVNCYEDCLAALKQCEHIIGMARLQGKLSDNALSPVNDALLAARAAIAKSYTVSV